MAEERSAADLFADDLMRIIGERLRLSVRHMGNDAQIVLIDSVTGYDLCFTTVRAIIETDSFTTVGGTRKRAVTGIELRGY